MLVFFLQSCATYCVILTLFHLPDSPFVWLQKVYFSELVLPNFVKEKTKNLIRNKGMNYKRLSWELYFFNIKNILSSFRSSWIFSLSHTGAFLHLLLVSFHRKCPHTVTVFSICWSVSIGFNSGKWLFLFPFVFVFFCRSCSNWALTSLTQKLQVLVSPKLRQNDSLHLISSLLTNLLFHNLSISLTWPC